eukprot:270044-Pleurochrysis_carterae.AAC.1
MREGCRGRADESDGRARPGGVRPIPRGGDSGVGRGGRRRGRPDGAPYGRLPADDATAPSHGDRAGRGVG